MTHCECLIPPTLSSHQLNYYSPKRLNIINKSPWKCAVKNRCLWWDHWCLPVSLAGRGARSLLLFFLGEWEGPDGERNALAVLSSSEGNVPTVWGWGGRRRVWERSQEHPQMRGTCWLCRGTWSTLGAAGRRLDFLAPSCLRSPGSSLSQWPVHWGWWQGLPVFSCCSAASLICCPCLRRLPVVHPHTHSVASLNL